MRQKKGKSTYSSNEEHAECLNEAAPHEGNATTKRIGKEEDKYETCHDLDNAIDTLGEESGGGGAKSEVGEDLGSVVVDGTGLFVRID